MKMSHNLHNTPLAPLSACVRAARTLGAVSAASLLLVLAAGCHDKAAQMHGEKFNNHQLQCATQRLAEVQAASGARADAMLHPQHFDGETLNSLGQRKLDLMIEDERAITPLTVYLDFPEADAHDEMRRRSVVLYLKERGLLDSQIKLENGINPATLTAALPNLTRLSKTENPGAGDAAGESAPAGLPTGMSK
jgi:hypothetical protein